MKRILIMVGVVVNLVLGGRISHAALYFPHFDTTTNVWQTEICVINNSATDTIQGNLESYSDPDGAVVLRPLSVPPNGRVQIDVGSQVVANRTGYLVFKNTSGSPVGYTKFTQVSGDRVAVPAVDGVNTDNLYVTHIAWPEFPYAWWTGIALVNTTAATKNLTIRFNTGQTRTVTLTAGQHRAFTIAGLLDNLIDTAVVSAVIENGSGVVGLELFGNGSQLGGVPLISGSASTLYYPHLANDSEWWTGAVAYNPSASTARVTVNPYSQSGTLLGSSPRDLPPGQKLVWPTDFSVPPDTAWFSLQSPIPLVGFELFGTHDQKRLAGYSSVDIDGKSGIFPKVEKSGGWTGIAFVNTEGSRATVTVKAYNDAGTLLGTGTKILNAHEKWVGNPNSLFPDVVVNAATYISFSTDRKVAGFQLNNNDPALNTRLDALPTTAPGGLKVIDKALDFIKYQSTLLLGVATVTDIMEQIGETSGSSTCPQVTITPDPSTINFEALPPAITLAASYGGGCTASDGSTMSGQMVLALTNIVWTEASEELALDYAVTATNLRRNGTLVLNGGVSGHLGFAGSGATVSINFNNFQITDGTISGGLTLALTGINVSGASASSIDITFVNDLTAVGYAVHSGTLRVTTVATNTNRIVANLDTSQGAVNMTLTVQRPSDERTIISTAAPGTIAGYTVTLTNVTLDTGVCNGYPSSGSATASQGGSSVTAAFTPSCPAMEMRDPVYPERAQDQNGWVNFSTYLYRYVTKNR
ncbi:MAG: hypothetical protein ACYC7J_19520 [Syntrophales bacterium]